MEGKLNLNVNHKLVFLVYVISKQSADDTDIHENKTKHGVPNLTC